MQKRFLGTEHVLLILGIVCLLIGGIIGYKYIYNVRQHHIPKLHQTNVNSIEGWMTIPFVAHTYRIPENELFKSLNVDPSQKKVSLNSLAKRQEVDSITFIENTKNIVSRMMEAQRQPSPVPSP